MPTHKPRPLPNHLVTAFFHPWSWKMAWRDSRSQRIRLFIFAMAIVAGIGSLVAIHSLKASVQRGIESQAKELLGSDLQVSSRSPISEGDMARLSSIATRSAREVSFPSMMTFPAGGTKMVQVRGFDGAYPFYGSVETSPASAWSEFTNQSGVLLELALLDQFQAKVGDDVKLGTLSLKVLGVIKKGAPRPSRFSGFAPEAYVQMHDLSRSGLLGTNSMASYQLHLELPNPPPSQQLKEQIRKEYPNTTWRLETPDDRRESLGDALNLFQRFLGILALASLALGALGVAGAVQSHVTRRIPTVAILRCLGAPAQLASAVYMIQTAVLGMIGALIGTAAGIVLQMSVLTIFKESLPVSVNPSPEWVVVARTGLAGFAVCCGFALIPLLKIQHVSPAATLRSGATLTSSILRTLPVYLLLGALLILLAFINDPDWKRSLALLGGLLGAFLILTGVARGLMAISRKLVRPSWPYLLRQGISNLYRPGNQTLLFLLSLGLGTFLLLTILLTGNLVQQRLSITHSKESPNLYLIDVQPDQIEGVSALVKSQSLPVLENAPMVTMRIQAIRGIPAAEAKGVPKWVPRREFRSTYRDHLNSTETLIAGEWYQHTPTADGLVPLSLEEKIAQDMGVKVGDAVTLDVQGVTMDAKVTSIRRVDWSRFNLNFFMVFPPGALEGAPGFNVITTRTSDSVATGKLQRDLSHQFGNVTAIDLTQILDTVRGILSKISLVVTVLGGFTLLAGLPIIIGTLLNGRDVRLKEGVLLRTLGASSNQVRSILTIEYATLGILSALTGVLLAVSANAALAVYVFKTPPWPDPTLVISTFAVVTLVSILGGLGLSRGISNHPPLEILRGGV